MPDVPVVERCDVKLHPPQVRILLSADKMCRDEIQRTVASDSRHRHWVAAQLLQILLKGEGCLAGPIGNDSLHRLRTPGAGILPLIEIENVERAILHIRASNRGLPWKATRQMDDVLTWKEFAGVMDAIERESDPQRLATKELYEELSFVADGRLLLPTGLNEYPDLRRTLALARQRANQYFNANAADERVTGIGDLLEDGYEFSVDQGEYVQVTVVTPDGTQTRQQGIVSYDPFSNKLEVSFVGRVRLRREPLTGILSLAGPEDWSPDKIPYFEDVIVVDLRELRAAQRGERLRVQHLLSVHGSKNWSHAHETLLHYSPSPTLEPIVAALNSTYTFESTIRKALNSIVEMPAVGS